MATREEVKKIAIRMVKELGLINLSLKGLCNQAGISDGSFKYLMGCTFTEFVRELEQEGHAKFTGKITKKRALPGIRKAHILEAAIELAKVHGYKNVTQNGVAEKAGISGGLVSRYFSTMNQLRKEIMRKAVLDSTLEIIAQGLASGDPQAKNAPQEVKEAALQFLTN